MFFMAGELAKFLETPKHTELCFFANAVICSIICVLGSSPMELDIRSSVQAKTVIIP
jgi:hypothetical protein